MIRRMIILWGLAVLWNGQSHSAAKQQASKDLVTPVMSGEAPAPGKRVRQVAPEYKGTKV